VQAHFAICLKQDPHQQDCMRCTAITEPFYTLREAQILIERWRHHYNTVRPHSALRYRPPAPESIVPIDQRPTMH
jgi:transposase InsO family protein